MSIEKVFYLIFFSSGCQ